MVIVRKREVAPSSSAAYIVICIYVSLGEHMQQLYCDADPQGRDKGNILLFIDRVVKRYNLREPLICVCFHCGDRERTNKRDGMFSLVYSYLSMKLP